MRPIHLGLRITLFAALFLGVVAIPADANTDISINFDELVFGAPGSVLVVAQVSVDEALQGRECTLEVHAKNQSSVHIGNDLIVSTGSSQAVIVGVEDTANGGTDQSYQMTMGSVIMVQLRIGQDGMSSLGFGLTFDCDEPTTPGTGAQIVSPPGETTTVPPATTTTAAPAPTVAGAVTTGLPETPAAQPVTRAPAYTG